MRFRTAWLVAAIAAFAVSACTSSGGAPPTDTKTGHDWFQARPLVMPGQRAIGSARTDPFGSLRVPTSEAAYNRLSRAQQTDLANALRGVDCAHLPRLSDSADRVLCDSYSNVFLLGAALFTGNDVTYAKPVPPSPSIVGWQVLLSLSPAASDTMRRWTTQHHVTVKSGEFNEVQTSSEPPCGPTAMTPCSYFTAFSSDDLVVTVPVFFAPVGKTVEIDGVFHRAFATRLAHRLAS